jgi:hypothetical protein
LSPDVTLSPVAKRSQVQPASFRDDPFTHHASKIGTTRKTQAPEGPASISLPLGERRDSDRYITVENNNKPKRLKPKNTSFHEIIDLEHEEVGIHPINLDEGKVIDIEQLESELESEIFLPQPLDGRKGIHLTRRSSARNPEVRYPMVKINDINCVDGLRLSIGNAIELVDGRFLEVKDIIEHRFTQDRTIRGWELQRNRDLHGELMRKLNELCYIFQVDLDDPRPMREQSVIEVGVDMVRRVRELTRTNYQFPAYRFDTETLPYFNDIQNRKYIETHGALVVRWEYITTFKTAKDRQLNGAFPRNYQSRQLVRLGEEQCDKDRSVPQCAQRFQWRPNTALGGLLERKVSNCARADERNTQRTYPFNNTRQTYIEISDDEGEGQTTHRPKQTSSSRIPPDARVSIQLTSHDFKELDPQAFLENIRGKFDAELKLQPGRGQKERVEKYSRVKDKNWKPKRLAQGGSRGAQTERRKPDERLGNDTAAAAYQYSYADACKFSFFPFSFVFFRKWN